MQLTVRKTRFFFFEESFYSSIPVAFRTTSEKMLIFDKWEGFHKKSLFAKKCILRGGLIIDIIIKNRISRYSPDKYM